MIQRIQTIFLAFAAIADFGLLAAPFASTPGEVNTSAIFADRVYSLQDHPGLLVLFLLAGVLAAASIFLFRNRPLQMRLTIFSTIALVLGIAFCLVYFLNNSAGLQQVEVNDRLGAYLPFLSLVLTLLAYRAIGKDEKLVQSMDRLR